MYIIGVDPGKMTGLALYDTEDGWRHAEVTPAEVIPKIRAWLRYFSEKPFLIAVERYQQPAGKKSFQPDAHDVVGAVRSLCDEIIVRCVYHSAASAKKMATTSRLKTAGAWHPTPDGHANDAARHVLLSLALYKPTEFARLTGV